MVTRPASSLARDRESSPAETSVLTTMLLRQLWYHVGAWHTYFRGHPPPCHKRRAPALPNYCGLWFSPTYAYTLWQWMTRFSVVNTCGEQRVLGARPCYCILRELVVRFVGDSRVSGQVIALSRDRQTDVPHPQWHPRNCS